MHASKRLGSASMARVCPLRPCKRHKLSIFSSAMSWSRGCEGIWYISLKPVGGSNSHDSLNGRQRAAYKKGRQAAGKQAAAATAAAAPRLGPLLYVASAYAKNTLSSILLYSFFCRPLPSVSSKRPCCCQGQVAAQFLLEALALLRLELPQRFLAVPSLPSPWATTLLGKQSLTGHFAEPYRLAPVLSLALAATWA